MKNSQEGTPDSPVAAWLYRFLAPWPETNCLIFLSCNTSYNTHFIRFHRDNAMRTPAASRMGVCSASFLLKCQQVTRCTLLHVFFFFWVWVGCRCPYVSFLTHSQPIVWNSLSLDLKLTDSARLSVQQAPRILLTLSLPGAEIIDVYHNSQVFTEVLRGLTQVITCDAIALSTGPLLHPQPEVIFLTVTFEE